MCGIAGFRCKKNADLDAMVISLRHRGPDERGTYTHGSVGLGHTRLSIIDLQSGHQPMTTPDGCTTVVFNGEIYNFRELRKDLEKKGVSFHTKSDTEVLLNMYAVYGTDMLEQLNGMFAFCIYDKQKDIIFGARDRIGIKPFYYSTNENGFFFASEIKSLLSSSCVSRAIDLVAIDHYFTFRYIPGTRTAFAEVKKLRPAHAFIQKADNTFHVWRYWDFHIGGGPEDFETALEQFDELLSDSVRLRLISDVPLGAFLSGGVDSTTIVGIMKKLGHSPLKTFTIGFGLDIDETREAEEAGRYYGCDHLSFEMPEKAFDMLGKAIYHMDEPFGDPIIIAYLLLSEQAAKSVRVVLTGEGADEGQMGYVHHEVLSSGLRLGRRMPRPMLNLAASIVRRLPVRVLDRRFKYPSSMGGAGRERLATLIPALKDPGKAYFKFISLFNDSEKALLFGPALRQARAEAQAEQLEWAETMNASSDPLDGYYRFDFKNWLPDNILNKQDRMTMACSIEGRVPFLDHRVVEFLASLPQDLKLRKGSGKFLLQKLYNSCYKPQTRGATSKKAFFMPIDGKFKPAFNRFADRFLSDSAVSSEFFNKEFVRSLRKRSAMSELLFDKQSMAVAIFNVWKEIFKVDNV